VLIRASLVHRVPRMNGEGVHVVGEATYTEQCHVGHSHTCSVAQDYAQPSRTLQ